MGGELSDVRIMEGDDGRGAIVSFPFDAAFVELFRMAFPRARWSDRHRAWRLPGTTAARRVTRWLDRELPATFTNADERGRDSFSFEPIVSPYLSAYSEIIVRTPYSRTVVAELRACPGLGGMVRTRPGTSPSDPSTRCVSDGLLSKRQLSATSQRRERCEARLRNPLPNMKAPKPGRTSGGGSVIPFPQPLCLRWTGS